MLAYPVQIEPDDDTFLVTSPDFPEVTTFGNDWSDATTHAIDALEEAIAARIHDGKEVPPPSEGANPVVLSGLTEARVIVYQEVRKQGIGKEELACQMGWDSSLVDFDQMFYIQHPSPMDLLDAALRAVGYQLAVTALAD